MLQKLVNFFTISGMDIVSDACMSIEALFLLINSSSQHQDVPLMARSSSSPSLVNRVLKDCLKSLVMLCKVRSDACDQFVDIVGGLLHSTSDPETKMLLCQVLAALGDMKPGVLNLILPDVCHMLSSASMETDEDTPVPVLVVLATLLFQSAKGHQWAPGLVTKSILFC